MKLFIGKKGIGIGQVFVFIIAAITFGLITIFGYQAISGFLQSGEEVAFVQFKTELESSIKKIYTEYDSVRKKDFTTPTNFERVCFVDLEYNPDPDNPLAVQEEIAELCDIDPVACGAWKSVVDEYPVDPAVRFAAADQNVFMKPPSPVTLKVHKISIYDSDGTRKVKGYLCEPIKNGRFPVILIGKGDRTGLIKASSIQ